MTEPIGTSDDIITNSGVEECKGALNEPQNEMSEREMNHLSVSKEQVDRDQQQQQDEYHNHNETITFDSNESPQDEFDAESDVLETPGDLQHGAAIILDDDDELQAIPPQHDDIDNSTISSSQQPEIILHEEEEQSIDLSSVGMGSVTQQAELYGHTTTLPIIPSASSRRRRTTWNPTSSRGRSRRWDAHPALATRPVVQSPRQTAPAILHEEQDEPDMEAQHDDDSSCAASWCSDQQVTSQSAVLDDSKATTASISPPSIIASPYTLLGAPDSKFSQYHVVVDSSQEDRAVEISLTSMARPHMRAFHLAWMAFFVAFFTWFALTPLLSEIALSLSLTKEEIWTSSILGVAGSAVTRILIGPICDVYGARWAMGMTLFASAIPMTLTGLVQTSVGLSILRLFIGLAGSAFVTSQYWTSSMFTVSVAGTANALVAGWGNLGGGVTQLVMGSLVFPTLKIAYGGDGWSRANAAASDSEQAYDRASDLAWRTACALPAIMCFTMTYFVIFKADDCPKGNYTKRNREGLMPSVAVRTSIVSGMHNINTWILFLEYGCCFGVEITMVNAAALYFKEEFGLSTELSAAVASIFGWMNLFARGLGGFLSDIFNAKYGMRGRLWVQTITLLVEGALVIVFSVTQSLGGAIVVMIAFSCFVQAAEGSTYAIVPYVNPRVTGSVSGIVGAGGNVGGVAFAAIFRSYDYRHAFSAMGVMAMISAIITIPIAIPGHASLFCGSDAPEVLERRSAHTEEMGNFPPVLLQQDPDQSRRSLVVDRDSSRRSRYASSCD